MAIRRSPRPDTRFYTVNKDLSEDTRLSWAARGMLIFLLGKPDNWEVSVAHLIKQTEMSQRPTGRDAVRGIIKELIEAGYMRAEGRREKGSFNGIDYVVSELPEFSPETENPAPANPQSPETGFPAPADAAPANPRLIKNDLKQGMIKATKNDLPATQNCVTAPGESTAEPSQEELATKFQETCKVTWKTYRDAYSKRYGIDPVRNAKVNSLVRQLVQRLGQEAASVAEFFVMHVNEAYVVRKTHELGALVAGAESYRTQWATGSSMTNTRAMQIDSTQANANAADEAIAMLRDKRARERGEHAQ
ncbi:Uncharacterised protein [Serratia fonticola]|uniref:hypothetical protein n=1 Tax=Serratia fonticola TaxID=47917 RepID=UPI00217BFCCA|nr:hypothetical protein [Serratia fonticola]CAI0697249.1 Uncharacterised protein [Serratia fonticola]